MRDKTNKTKFYCLFGFDKDNEDSVGYFGKKLDIVSELSDAMIFPSSNIHKKNGFGTPKKWCNFINEDSDLNHNFVFHLVGVNKKTVDNN